MAAIGETPAVLLEDDIREAAVMRSYGQHKRHFTLDRTKATQLEVLLTQQYTAPLEAEMEACLRRCERQIGMLGQLSDYMTQEEFDGHAVHPCHKFLAGPLHPPECSSCRTS